MNLLFNIRKLKDKRFTSGQPAAVPPADAFQHKLPRRRAEETMKELDDFAATMKELDDFQIESDSDDDSFDDIDFSGVVDTAKSVLRAQQYEDQTTTKQHRMRLAAIAGLVLMFVIIMGIAVGSLVDASGRSTPLSPEAPIAEETLLAAVPMMEDVGVNAMSDDFYTNVTTNFTTDEP